jgi:hypothetical protein
MYKILRPGGRRLGIDLVVDLGGELRVADKGLRRGGGNGQKKWASERGRRYREAKIQNVTFRMSR